MKACCWSPFDIFFPTGALRRLMMNSAQPLMITSAGHLSRIMVSPRNQPLPAVALHDCQIQERADCLPSPSHSPQTLSTLSSSLSAPTIFCHCHRLIAVRCVPNLALMFDIPQPTFHSFFF